jgi:hypothetical protein
MLQDVPRQLGEDVLNDLDEVLHADDCCDVTDSAGETALVLDATKLQEASGRLVAGEVRKPLRLNDICECLRLSPCFDLVGDLPVDRQVPKRRRL